MATIISISDTHTQHDLLTSELLDIHHKNPDGILIHCGDISHRGRNHEVEDFLDWYSSLPFEHKILISGNHDFLFENNRSLAKAMISERGENIIYLEDSGVEIQGLKFWGSPVTPWFYDWAFNRREDIKNHWDLIPNDVNILITHGPPYKILDQTISGLNVGCKNLSKKIESLTSLKLSLFGHIHEAAGLVKIGDVIYNNASILDERYQIKNHPYVFHI